LVSVANRDGFEAIPGDEIAWDFTYEVGHGVSQAGEPGVVLRITPMLGGRVLQLGFIPERAGQVGTMLVDAAEKALGLTDDEPD
jgi:hypothetical protein